MSGVLFLGRLIACITIVFFSFIRPASPNSGTDENPHESIYFAALSAEKAGDYAQAQSLYTQYLEVDSFSVNRQSARLKTQLIKEGIAADAVAELGHYIRAINYRAEGEYKTAVSELQSIIQLGKDAHFYDDAMYLCGFIELSDRNNVAAAIDYFRRLVSELPGSNYIDTSLFSLGLAFEQAGNYTAAEETYAELVEKHSRISIDFAGLSFARDNALSRIWHRRARTKLEALEEKQVAIANSQTILSTEDLAIAMGARLSYDQPVGSKKNYRYVWHLFDEYNIEATHITHWLTRKTNWRWETENRLLAASKAGFTPVVAYWYFGDQISPEFVEANLDEYRKQISSKLIPLIAKLPHVVVLLEPEFNKAGIQNWMKWGEIAQDVITEIKRRVPQAEVGLGIGDWAVNGQEKLFSNIEDAVKVSDFVGYIAMTSAAHESANSQSTAGIVERIYQITRILNKQFDKPLFLGYVAISSGHGWQQKQARYLSDFITYVPYFMSQGLRGFGYFSLFDNPNQAGWFSGDERHFGLVDREGERKPSLNSWNTKIQYLLNLDKSSPKLLAPPQVNSRGLDGEITISGEFSEWTNWSASILGVASGAKKTFQGAGKQFSVHWNGLADSKMFLPEVCVLDISGRDKAGNELLKPKAQRFTLHMPRRLITETSLNSRQINARVSTWGKTASTVSGDRTKFTINSAYGGVSIPLALSSISEEPIVVDLDFSGEPNFSEIRVGFQDENGVISFAAAELFTKQDSQGSDTLRISLESIPEMGELFDKTTNTTSAKALNKAQLKNVVISNRYVPATVELTGLSIHRVRVLNAPVSLTQKGVGAAANEHSFSGVFEVMP
ncbi:MAG: tetratricopeptide repeat protein [Pseudomonadota bacterium]